MEATTEQHMSGPARRSGESVAIAHEQLRTMILRGELAPGQVARQAGLSKELGVGRTPLREAFRLLEREGLVVGQPNRQIRIAGVSASDAEQIYVMRIALESLAMQLTIPELTTAELAELEGLLAQIDFYIRNNDRANAAPPHSAFHRMLTSSAGPYVERMIAQLLSHAERYWRATIDVRNPEDERDEHHAILKAASANEPKLAAEYLVAHYARAAKIIITALDPLYTPRRLQEATEIIAPLAVREA